MKQTSDLRPRTSDSRSKDRLKVSVARPRTDGFGVLTVPYNDPV
jgi:hypothetical protein